MFDEAPSATAMRILQECVEGKALTLNYVPMAFLRALVSAKGSLIAVEEEITLKDFTLLAIRVSLKEIPIRFGNEDYAEVTDHHVFAFLQRLLLQPGQLLKTHGPNEGRYHGLKGDFLIVHVRLSKFPFPSRRVTRLTITQKRGPKETVIELFGEDTTIQT
jgi:hypothetical protein